ncbi:MAG: HEAT repeat domain-containing protein [Sedimentisphaerales bacterium]|nr:HEAT repeat domain-containing protein [Sedimentisphaerales bacterium]
MRRASPLRWIAVLGLLMVAPGCEQPAPTTPSSTAALPPVEGPVVQAQEILLAALIDSDPRLRANAMEVIATTGQTRLMPRTQALFQDRVFPVRFHAVVAVGDLQYAPAQEVVKAMLNDPDENVKLGAAYALMKLGQAEHFRTLCEGVMSTDQTVRANAALLLGKSGRPEEALRFLYWTLQQRDSADKVMFQAAQSIAMLGDERIYPKLWTRLISAYADDRVVGIEGMGALGTAQAKNALVTMLDDPVVEVRLAAAAQLGKLGEPIGEAEVLDALQKDLADATDPRGRERVRVLAALAIGEIRTAPLTRHLPKLLADPSTRVRLAAAKAVLQATAKYRESLPAAT